jgi:uncharacterized protein DUF1549/uncharacterized protein DUF1553
MGIFMMHSRSLLCAGLALAGLPVLLAASPADAAPRKKAPARKPAAASTAPATSKAPAVSTPTIAKDLADLDIAPASALLNGPRSEQRLVVIGTTKDGATVDVTDHVTFTAANPKLVKIAGGVAYPLADGETRIVAKLGTLSSSPMGITVQGAGQPAATEFVNDIMPILAKGGCNNTACHGSPAGKGGFKLSLFGYEPELDHPAIVKDADGKRVNLKEPAKSLMLTKPAMAVAHAGGQRFKPGSAEYKTMLAWLQAGAPGIGEFEARVKKVDLLPAQPWMPGPGSKQRLAVTAVMSDGSTQDVTEKALFSSNDDAIADVNGSGVVIAKRSGETAVMVRYLGQVAVARVAVLSANRPNPYPKLAKNNYIDELVQAKLQKLRMVPSDPCTDEEFIRRAMLDVCGIIPTVDEVRAFVADRAADKRAKLIDKLLARPEYVDLWTMKWNDTLRNNPRLTRLGTGSYAKWIREQIAQNRPYNEFVRDLLTATGRATEAQLDPNNLPRQLRDRPNVERLIQQINSVPPNPAANYFVISRDPLDTTSATSQIFLGVRIECARCHNHPFEKWTQNDYYGLAAFFTGIRAQGGNQAPNIVLVNERAPGPRHPKTNELVEPKHLDDTEVKIPAGTDKRVVVAEWMTAPNNPWLSRALVNRLWGHYFGRGIVEPIDDFRVTNPASNPELLDALAKDFVDKKFDVKAIHRVILNSRTYQQSYRPNQYNTHDTSNFARYYPKRMMAEQLYDSISQATGIFLQAPGRGGRRPAAANLMAQALQDAMPDGPVTRVMQLPALLGNVGGGGGRRGNGDVAQFLDAFGKPRREAVCECERSSEGNMGQALALINGNEVNDKIAAPSGRVQQVVRSGKPDGEVIEELYLAALSRRPTKQEVDDALSLVRSSTSKAEGFEDVMWSLLNSREFLFIH